MKKTFRAQERDRADVLAKETAFLEEVSKLKASDLIFIDETSTYLEMTRSHARSPVGEKAICKRSAGRKSNISLVGAISTQGMQELYPYDGSIDGERFLDFLDRLLPKLRPGNVIVMDNLMVHHIAEVKERLKIAEIGLLYLPPYSSMPAMLYSDEKNCKVFSQGKSE